MYSKLEALAALPMLVIFGISGALAGLVRRGARLERLDRDQLNREAAIRQFQVSHLLLVVSIVSLLLALCVHFHSGPSRQISMRWDRPDNAPIYSAETALLSSLVLIAITLSLIWATLCMGRPGLRLCLTIVSAGLLGAGWAYAFTAPNHAQFLVYNTLFSSSVGLGQALLIGGVLLVVRRRGYRLIRGRDGPDCIGPAARYS